MALKGIFLAIVLVIVTDVGSIVISDKNMKTFWKKHYTLRPCKDIHSKVNIIKHVFSILAFSTMQN